MTCLVCAYESDLMNFLFSESSTGGQPVGARAYSRHIPNIEFFVIGDFEDDILILEKKTYHLKNGWLEDNFFHFMARPFLLTGKLPV